MGIIIILKPASMANSAIMLDTKLKLYKSSKIGGNLEMFEGVHTGDQKDARWSYRCLHFCNDKSQVIYGFGKRMVIVCFGIFLILDY